MNWKRIYSTDLTIPENGTNNVSVHGGVYIWRKCLALNPEVVIEPERFLEWLDKGVSTPIVSAKDIKISRKTKAGKVAVRDDFLSFGHAVVGGGSLTKSKKDELRNELSDNADTLYEIFHSASVDYGPILYVGESKCLQKRIQTHISEKSDFRQKLFELGLDIEDTVLYYLEMKDKSDRERQLIEQIFTHLFVAPLTHRAG